jgi:hypothetical protein
VNTPPIVSPEAWEAARQKTLAKEKVAVHALAAERRRMPWMAVENHLRNFPPGPLPDQTEVSARPHAGKAPGYQAGAAAADATADTRAGEMAQAGRRVAYEFEGPNGKVSPTALENHSRGLSPFLIVFCSGVAATLAWWSYGDAARRMIARSYPQLRSSVAPRVQTVPETPSIVVPYPNQLGATLRDHTTGPNLDRTVAGQELTRNTDQTTSVDQAHSAQADSVPLESRGDAALLQPTVPLNIKPTEAKALQTLSKKGTAANQYDASCLPSASAVLRNQPGVRPTWTLRTPGHEGTQCWYAATRPRASDLSRASDHRTGTTESGLSAPSFP